MATYGELREVFKEIQTKRKNLKDLIGDDFLLPNNKESFYKKISDEFKNTKKNISNIKNIYNKLSENLTKSKDKIDKYSNKVAKVLDKNENQKLLDLGNQFNSIEKNIKKIKTQKIKAFYGESQEKAKKYSIVKKHCNSKQKNEAELVSNDILEYAKNYNEWIKKRIDIVKGNPESREGKTLKEALEKLKFCNNELSNIKNLLDEISNSQIYAATSGIVKTIVTKTNIVALTFGALCTYIYNLYNSRG